MIIYNIHMKTFSLKLVTDTDTQDTDKNFKILIYKEAN